MNFSLIDLVVSAFQAYDSLALKAIGSSVISWIVGRLLNRFRPPVKSLPKVSAPLIVVHTANGYVVFLCLTEAVHQIIYVLPPSA